MRVLPQRDDVLCKMDDEADDYHGVIEIPDVAKSVQKWATVVGVGPQVKQASKGDRVMIPWATGTDLDIYNERYRFMSEGQLLAKEKAS